uniref:Protein quiver n=1 Tax=Panagrellus redivivus TaxID=6233 RepID=A0A7E4V496_PANRE
MLHVSRTAITVVILAVVIPQGWGITCYECQSSNGADCKYTGTTCAYGMFGCIKIAAYSGGVDKLGNWYDQSRSIITMMRGCSVIPIGGVDACQQQTILGVRLVTCYCFTDYCNLSPPAYTNSLRIAVSTFLSLTLYRFFA